MGTNKVVKRLEDGVSSVLQEYKLTSGASFIVAVSGGSDSLALLFSMYRLRNKLGLNLHGAHLNHGLRGKNSESDAEFVAQVFQNLGIDFTSERIDVLGYRKHHRLSLEDACRQVRYKFLVHVAEKQQTENIALGHNSNDQAETVLMHIIRGSGLTGIRGMDLMTFHAVDGVKVRLVRPLLQSSKEDTLDYCKELGLKPRRDESNLSVEPSRNRVRIELLPLLEQFNPAVRNALTRLSQNAAQGVEYIENQMDTSWGRTVHKTKDYISLKKDEFNQLDPAIQSYLLRRAVSLMKGDLNDIKKSHLENMADLMTGPAGRILHLPKGIRFSMGYNEGIITQIQDNNCPFPILNGEHQLNIPGETLVCGWKITATLAATGSPQFLPRTSPIDEYLSNHHKNSVSDPVLDHHTAELIAYFRYEKVGPKLSIRARRPGDRFQPLGMSGQKKIQDFMVDAKIPQKWRGRVPLVTSPKGIVWIAGWRIANWAQPKTEDSKSLKLRLVRKIE